MNFTIKTKSKHDSMTSENAITKIFLFLIFLSLSAIFQWASLHFGYKRYFFNAELLISFFLISINKKLIGDTHKSIRSKCVEINYQQRETNSDDLSVKPLR